MENKEHILGTALELEDKGFRFYSEAARKTENETGRKMFAQLAKEEQEHIESLREKFSTLYPERAHKDIPVFETEVSKYSGEVEALKIGRDMEKESIAFYSEWAKGDLQPLFASLIEFEKKHLEVLEAELDYVLRTGYWFDYFESSLED
ncbi:MAG: ferritin family protein [Theionarchaea archaeon]|nr:ferritin family protein [Theionarchaea archaeon]MBU7038864.1 ferritin family protein [Theionarchaea archaeon]